MCFKFNYNFIFLFLLLLNWQFELPCCGFYSSILRIVSLFDLNIFIFFFLITFNLLFFCKKIINKQVYFFLPSLFILIFFLIKLHTNSYKIFFLPEKLYFFKLFTLLNVFEGPSYLHGVSFLFFFSLIFVVSNFFFAQINVINVKILSWKFVFLFQFLSVFVFISGAYWAFFSSVWGNWYNNDAVELFYIIFFFFTTYLLHAFKKYSITFIYVFFWLAILFLCLLRFGFFNSKHAGSTHIYKTYVFGGLLFFIFNCFMLFLFIKLLTYLFMFLCLRTNTFTVIRNLQLPISFVFLFFTLTPIFFFLCFLFCIKTFNLFFLQFYFFLSLFFFILICLLLLYLYVNKFYFICFIFYHLFFMLFLVGWFLYSWSYFLPQTSTFFKQQFNRYYVYYSFCTYKQVEFVTQGNNQTLVSQYNTYKHKLHTLTTVIVSQYYQNLMCFFFNTPKIRLLWNSKNLKTDFFIFFFKAKYYQLMQFSNESINFMSFVKPVNNTPTGYSKLIQFDFIYIVCALFVVLFIFLFLF